MNRRGVCYDVGRVMRGQDWRPEFSPEEARRELPIIRDDLHCNAVRICGQDLGRLMAAGGPALDCGLQVWLSPELWDRSRLGTTYPGMPWEPMQSFRAVADFYTAHTPPAP